MIRRTSATLAQSPESPERLEFSPYEAVLGLRALAYYITSELQGNPSEINTLGEAYYLTTARVILANSVINEKFKIVETNKNVADKLTAATHEPSNPVRLENNELTHFGLALFRMGTRGIKHTREALNNEDLKLSFYSEAEKRGVQSKVERIALDVYDLYQELTPIAQSKRPYVYWMEWLIPTMPNVTTGVRE